MPKEMKSIASLELLGQRGNGADVHDQRVIALDVVKQSGHDVPP